jgi:hypothetical protein
LALAWARQPANVQGREDYVGRYADRVCAAT